MNDSFSVLEHELVPQHIILSEKETEEVLKKYDIKAEQLPKIFSTDPAVKSIGAEPGQVIKIIRESQTAKKAVSYRLVIETEKTRIKTRKKKRKEEKKRKRKAKKKAKKAAKKAKKAKAKKKKSKKKSKKSSKNKKKKSKKGSR